MTVNGIREAATMRQMTKTMIKGSPSYCVTENDHEIARAHCVNVPNNLFTLVVGGKWSGVAPEAVVVAKLQAMAEGC